MKKNEIKADFKVYSLRNYSLDDVQSLIDGYTGDPESFTYMKASYEMVKISKELDDAGKWEAANFLLRASTIILGGDNTCVRWASAMDKEVERAIETFKPQGNVYPLSGFYRRGIV